MSALLGELSSLTRDMLIRMTAPEGGAALLSGAYDTAMMDNLAQGVAPTRLIYMTTQLQTTLAALPLSTNRRTDAELCLMRLCDETLCGDVTAFAARLARLEEGGIPAARPATPAPTPAPMPKSPPAVQAVPSTPEPKPSAPKAVEVPPWEEPPPILASAPDTPPWSEEPPPFDDSDAPPPYGEPVTQQSAPASAPVPAAPAVPAPQSAAPSGDSSLWWTLIEKYKDRVSPMYQFMLDDACGEVEGDVLVVRCGDDLTRDSLDCPGVVEALSTVTGQHLGRTISVRFIIAQKGEQSGEDRMEALIRAGSKFENFSVK